MPSLIRVGWFAEDEKDFVVATNFGGEWNKDGGTFASGADGACGSGGIVLAHVGEGVAEDAGGRTDNFDGVTEGEVTGVEEDFGDFRLGVEFEDRTEESAFFGCLITRGTAPSCHILR